MPSYQRILFYEIAHFILQFPSQNKMHCSIFIIASESEFFFERWVLFWFANTLLLFVLWVLQGRETVYVLHFFISWIIFKYIQLWTWLYIACFTLLCTLKHYVQCLVSSSLKDFVVTYCTKVVLNRAELM